MIRRCFPLALLLAPALVSAQEAGPTVLPIDPARLAPGRDSFAILIQGNPLGFQLSRLERTPDGFRYTEDTSIGGFVEQRTEILTDGRFRVRRVSQTGTIQGQETRIEIEVTEGRATGTAITPSPEGMRTVTIDTTIPPDVLEENLIQPVLTALPWAPEARWTFTVFSSASGETRPMTLAVGPVDTVSAPNGMVETYRVDLTGGPQSITFWITTQAPHRVTKVAIAGTPIEIVRRGLGPED